MKNYNVSNFFFFFNNNLTYPFPSVMLLESGRVVEYSPPGELLSNKKSSFYAMAKDAGIVG